MKILGSFPKFFRVLLRRQGRRWRDTGIDQESLFICLHSNAVHWHAANAIHLLLWLPFISNHLNNLKTSILYVKKRKGKMSYVTEKRKLSMQHINEIWHSDLATNHLLWISIFVQFYLPKVQNSGSKGVAASPENDMHW